MLWIASWIYRRSSARFSSTSSRTPLGPSQISKKKNRNNIQPQVEQLEEKVLLSGFSPTYVLHPLHGGGTMGPASSSAPPSTALTPAQLRTAYGLNGITFQGNGGTITGNGSGETIAIVDAYDDPSIAADLTTFDQQFGLAAPPNFVKVGMNQSGVASTTSFPAANQAWAGEIELDVEYAHAMAPAATILLVEAYNSSDSSLMSAVDYARNYSGVVAVSMSWGETEYSGETGHDSHFITPAGHTGVTFFASTGDSSTIGYPATSSHVVAVGGTTLTVDSAGDYQGESAWSDGGGGLSLDVSQPGYQSGLVIHSGSQIISPNGMRAGPDVAWDGDPNSGVAVYGSYGFGGWAQIGGTSAGSPAWAGLMAVVDQGRAAAGLSSLDGYTQTLPALYALPSSDFHDITTGSNANGATAGPGFDLVTGRGSPVANLLVAALAGNNGGASGAKPPTVSQAAKAVLSSTNTAVNLSALGLDAAGDANPTYTWSVTGTPPAAVAFTSNGTSNSNATTAQLSRAGTYSFLVTITDPSTGLSATSQVSITVGQVQSSIAVSPATASIAVNATQQFSATVRDQFGVAMATQPTVIWSLASGSAGSISATGLFTAGSAAGTATVKVSAGSLSALASVSIIGQVATTSTLTAGPVNYYGSYALETLTLVITPASGTVLPTGTVALYYDGSFLGTATIQIVNGVAEVQSNIRFYANGNYSFSAEYMGSSSFQASTSNTVTVTV